MRNVNELSTFTIDRFLCKSLPQNRRSQDVAVFFYHCVAEDQMFARVHDQLQQIHNNDKLSVDERGQRRYREFDARVFVLFVSARCTVTRRTHGSCLGS